MMPREWGLLPQRGGQTLVLSETEDETGSARVVDSFEACVLCIAGALTERHPTHARRIRGIIMICLPCCIFEINSDMCMGRSYWKRTVVRRIR